MARQHRNDMYGPGTGSAETAKMLEDAKRLSESMWVVRHAMQCNVCAEAAGAARPGGSYGDGGWDDGALAAGRPKYCGRATPDDEEVCDDAYGPGLQSSSSQGYNCPVAGCLAAKLVLRVIEEQEKVNIDGRAAPEILAAACGHVNDVIRHSAMCPWASGPAESGTEPCLLCALVSRARPVYRAGRLVLDFSRRSKGDVPDFSPPQHLLEECPPELRRSSTTEELALLLSDLSRRPDDHQDDRPRPGHRRRRPTPVYSYHNNESTEDEDAADQSSPSFSDREADRLHAYAHRTQPAFPQQRGDPKRRRRDVDPLSRLRIPSQAVTPRTMPRSPSFSAAANSLLALTGAKPRSPGQPRSDNIVGAVAPLLC